MGKTGTLVLRSISGTSYNGPFILRKIIEFTLVIILIQLALSLLFEFPGYINLFLIGLFLLFSSTFLLLKVGKELLSKIIFLSCSYLIIVALTPIFGYTINTHLFLIPGVGMSLIMFDQEIGNKKWIFVFAGIPVLLVIELWLKDLTPLVDINQEVAGTVGTINLYFTMITSIYMFYLFTGQLNGQLRKTNNARLRKEKAVEKLRKFNHLLAHDLKSPLGTIGNVLELINSGNLSKEKTNELLLLLNDKADSSLRLVNGITQYFSETRQQMPEWVETQTLIDEIKSLITIPDNFTIRTQNLPGAHISPIVLRQIMQNLVSNAIKYNDKAEGWLEISYVENGSNGTLSFRDNGIGMTRSQQESAFELYTMFDQMARESSSGIGLAIVHELVDNNGGTISIDSEPGLGTAFNVSFPLELFR